VQTKASEFRRNEHCSFLRSGRQAASANKVPANLGAMEAPNMGNEVSRRDGGEIARQEPKTDRRAGAKAAKGSITQGYSLYT